MQRVLIHALPREFAGPFFIIPDNELTYFVRQLIAETGKTQKLQQRAQNKAAQHHRHGNNPAVPEEIGEIPTHFRTDHHILRLAHQGQGAAQSRAHGRVHDQIAQKALEGGSFLFRLLLGNARVGIAHPMIDGVKIKNDGNKHGQHRQRVQKTGKRGGGHTKHQRNLPFFPELQKKAGENQRKHILEVVDAGHHENKQKQGGQVGGYFAVYRFRPGQADGGGLQGQQPSGRHRVHLQGQGQSKNKLQQNQPARHKGADQEKDGRIQQQKA